MVNGSSETRGNKLLIWAGKGNHRELFFDDAHVFETQTREWTRNLSQHAAHSGDSIPSSRWKTFASYSSALGGALVFGGSTRPHQYFNDLWLLKLQSNASSSNGKPNDEVVWEKAQIEPSSTLTLNGRNYNMDSDEPGPVPIARRAFGAALLPSNIKGKQTLAVALGRDERWLSIILLHSFFLFHYTMHVCNHRFFHFLRHRGQLLEDTWLGEIDWPKVRWRKVWEAGMTPPEATHGTEGVKPPPRRGHATVYIENNY